MLQPVLEKQFIKDIKQATKRRKDLQKLNDIINALLQEQLLPQKNKNHKLQGEYKDHWECHIQPDWLLIYRKTSTELILVRTGSHSDLF